MWKINPITRLNCGTKHSWCGAFRVCVFRYLCLSPSVLASIYLSHESIAIYLSLSQSVPSLSICEINTSTIRVPCLSSSWENRITLHGGPTALSPFHDHALHLSTQQGRTPIAGGVRGSGDVRSQSSRETSDLKKNRKPGKKPAGYRRKRENRQKTT